MRPAGRAAQYGQRPEQVGGEQQPGQTFRNADWASAKQQLLARLRSLQAVSIGACWKSGAAIEGKVFLTPEPAGAKPLASVDVIAALKISGVVERIGDYAKNIAKRVGHIEIGRAHV